VPGPAPPACAPYEDNNGRLLWGDPLLDQPGFPVPGWVASVEVGAVLPFFGAGPFSFPVTVGGTSVNIAPPIAGLNWTAAPKFDLGYRLGAGFGEFLLSYRFVASEGTRAAPGFGPSGLGQAHGRMNFNVIDFGYASHEWSLGPGWDMRWDAGVRFASFFYDTLGVAPGLEQRGSNYYLGGGVKGGLGIRRAVAGVPGLTAGGRFEGSYLLGQTRQNFAEVITPAGGPAVGGADGFRAGMTVASVALEASIGYAPGWLGARSCIEAGYRYEHWWSIGEAETNHGELELQTFFVRWKYNY
jgi:hypothetical protein